MTSIDLDTDISHCVLVSDALDEQIEIPLSLCWLPPRSNQSPCSNARQGFPATSIYKIRLTRDPRRQ